MNYNDWFISTKLPEPLTKDELYSCLEKVRKGDLKAREYVITHNIRLVINQVRKKFGSVPYDKKELVSIGLIGLIKSVDTFDISKNYEFSSYATTCIDNEILMFIRKWKRHIFDQSLYTPISVKSDGEEKNIEDVLEDTTADFVSEYEDTILYNEIRKIVYNLPDRDRKIILLYFGFINNKRYTQYEISKKLNISEFYVSKLTKKIVKKIGLQLKRKGLIDRVGRIDRVKEGLGDNELEMNKTTNAGRRLQTLYEYLNEYSKEQINEMISKLTDEERNLIELRYGSDLENPVTSELWGQKEINKFYGSLIPKMRRLLSNPKEKIGKTKESIKIVNDTDDKLDIMNKEDQLLSQSVIKEKCFEKEDFVKNSQLMKTPTFVDMLNELTPKEVVIIILKLGYVDGKYFSTELIADFLEIEQEEVRKITKKVLMFYKENINQSIDDIVDVFTVQSPVLKRKNN